MAKSAADPEMTLRNVYTAEATCVTGISSSKPVLRFSHSPNPPHTKTTTFQPQRQLTPGLGGPETKPGEGRRRRRLGPPERSEGGRFLPAEERGREVGGNRSHQDKLFQGVCHFPLPPALFGPQEPSPRPFGPGDQGKRDLPQAPSGWGTKATDRGYGGDQNRFGVGRTAIALELAGSPDVYVVSLVDQVGSSLSMEGQSSK